MFQLICYILVGLVAGVIETLGAPRSEETAPFLTDTFLGIKGLR